jgi:hypothetical protein
LDQRVTEQIADGAGALSVEVPKATGEVWIRLH